MTDFTVYRVEIEASATGSGSIVVGGHDISNRARGFTLRSRVGEVTTLEVELAALAAGAHAGASVRIDAETHALLVGLGWTPPPDPASAHPPGGAVAA